MKPKILFHLKKDKTFTLDFVPLNKFNNDCIFINNNDILLILEGIITNSSELLSKDETIQNLIIKNLHNLPYILDKLRGNFYILLYDKKTNKLTVSTDQWSSKFIFYSTISMDIDFNEYCFSIPMKHRMNHNLYKKWIIEKYPDASKFVWKKNNKLITYKPLNISFRNKEYDLKEIHKAILFKLGFIKPALETKNHMNPIDYWYTNYLHNEWDNYFQTKIELLNQFKELKKDVENFYKTGNAINKSQCLTLLAIYNLYFS